MTGSETLEDSFVPENCRTAAIDAIWKAVGEIPGCHVTHEHWDNTGDAPYPGDDMTNLRDHEWPERFPLIIRIQGWSISFHRSYHEVVIDLPKTNVPGDFVKALLVGMEPLLDLQRKRLRLARRAGVGLPLDADIVDLVSVDVLHFVLGYLSTQTERISETMEDMVNEVRDLVATANSLEDSDTDYVADEDGCLDAAAEDTGTTDEKYPIYSPMTSYCTEEDGPIKTVYGSMIMLAGVELPDTVMIQLSGSSLKAVTTDFPELGERIIESVEQSPDDNGAPVLLVKLVPDMWLISELAELDDELLRLHYPWINDLPADISMGFVEPRHET